MNFAFHNRADAGRRLEKKLQAYAGSEDVIVLGLARGGVPVAYEVAKHLRLPLDVLVVRKLGVPGYGELAMGAIASGGVRVINENVLRALHPYGEKIVEAIARRELAELERREKEYRNGRAPLAVRDRTVIVVDDGLATGASMRAAAEALRQAGAARIVIAVPVGAPETCRELKERGGEIICELTPPAFDAVGPYYRDFSQTTDQEVRDLLERAANEWNTPLSSPPA